MSRRSRKDTEPAQGVVGDPDDQRPRHEADDADSPSRTARKRASWELQDIGEQLVALRADLLAGLSLPDSLLAAVAEGKRLTNFGAKRRHGQYVGKLMRRLDPETLEAVRTALGAARGPSVKETALLHRAEQWRDSLLADDAELERWLAEFPAADEQRLRSLIREARKDERESYPGEAVRRGPAYRELFTLVSAKLRATAAAALAGSTTDP